MLTSEEIWNTPHYDIDGNRMTLLQLVRKDPEWAASRIAHERVELEYLKVEIYRLRGQCIRWEAMYAGMTAERDGYREECDSLKAEIRAGGPR